MKLNGITALAVMAGGAMAAEEQPMEFNMPDSGLVPCYGAVQFTTSMGERHGGSHLSLTSYRAAFPILDPRKSRVGIWRISASLDADMTVLGTGGDLDLRRNELYTFTLPVTFIRPRQDGGYLALGCAPIAASDFAGATRAWDFVPFVNYKVQVGDTFNYTLGVAVCPRFARHSVVPLIGFSWPPSPEWEVRLDKGRLAALYSSDGRLKVGPYVAAHGASWMVDTPEGDRIFRVRSVSLGLCGEYDFHKGDQPKRIIFASMGVTVATRADFCDRSGDKDHYETHHYKPGFIMSVGVDFRF